VALTTGNATPTTAVRPATPTAAAPAQLATTGSETVVTKTLVPRTAASHSASAPEALLLSNTTLVPGEATILSGMGCDPGAEVVVLIDGKEVGLTMANGQGTFSTSLTPPDLGAGQATVVARCGSKTFTALVSMVATSRVSAPEGSVAVFGIFVLLGVVLVRGQVNSNGTRRRRRKRGASDLLDEIG